MNNDEKVDSSESRKLLRVSETVRVGRNVQSNEAQIKVRAVVMYEPQACVRCDRRAVSEKAWLIQFAVMQ